MPAEALPIRDEVICISQPSTADEVDEGGYLEANPDVRASGLGAREHFTARGLTEGRMQSVNAVEIRKMRDAKLARVTFLPGLEDERTPGAPANFLTTEMVAEFAIPDLPPVSAHPYPASVVQLIQRNRDRLFLDVGAGLRDVYYRNVVNTEIYPSLSTDVLCVGEALPFADDQFDFVFCFATLEHTRRPWDVAGEICRVLKPGGTVMIDYPFLQPVHGYPHHYFNATPMGNRSLFEHACEIQSLEIGWHQHPIIGLQWALTVFRQGLTDPDARQFENLLISDLVGSDLEKLLEQPYCRNLHPAAQKVIASGSMLVAVKKASCDVPVKLTRPNAESRAAQEIALLRHHNDLLRHDIQTLRRSTSWRVTAPLRSVGRVLRGRRPH